MGSRPVWRVRDRASFAALRRDGRRGGRGSVSVTFVPASSGSTGAASPTGVRAAFAVGRAAGGAVVRNRLRRRLRAVVDDLARDGAGLPDGTYLVSARAEAQGLTPLELREAVAAAITAATGPTGPTHGAEPVGR